MTSVKTSVRASASSLLKPAHTECYLKSLTRKIVQNTFSALNIHPGKLLEDGHITPKMKFLSHIICEHENLFIKQ